jgi:aerobic-type carbon monoxide dehydrogenase small subunit (CoxS/CutS family)
LRHNRTVPGITELNVNGTARRVGVDASRSLLSILRDDLDLTGTKFGCGEGQCAACTVLVDGQPMKSCLTKAGSVLGKRIVTIEGLAEGGKLHPVQAAFLEDDAMQCGWCTPGMILGAVGLLTRFPNPTDADILSGMEGHICRCGTYSRVIAAIHRAAVRKGARP